MGKPKITVIGAGSYFFGRPVIHKMASSGVLGGGTLALVDKDPHVLKTMMDLAVRVFGETGSGTKVTGSTDRKEVLAGSDFVVLTFSDRNTRFRGIDTEISAKHGIRMCSSDTIGPGGIFRALREIPHMLKMAQDVKELAPEAWVVNFVNPTAVLGIALMRYAPDVKSFSLCDGHHEPYIRRRWLEEVGILPAGGSGPLPPEVESRLDIAIGGVNHCTWLVRFNYGGRDMLPVWRRKLAEMADNEKPLEKSKERWDNKYALQLMDVYGAYPTANAHTKEYVPFFQGYGAAPNYPEPLALFNAGERAEEMSAQWKETEGYSNGKLSVKEFMENVKSDHATDIIESMWGGGGESFYINTANRGAVTNMAGDAFLELRCDVDMQGVRPQPFGEFPRGLLALQQQVLDTHELTAEAAVTGDRGILLRAMMTDPIINNIGDAKNCLEELLGAERDALPSHWY